MPLEEQVRSTRRQVRRGIGMAQRLASGAFGLGPGATVAWLSEEFEHRRHRPEPGPVTNSGITWVVADDQRTTLVWVHNYWSGAYGIERPTISATLLDLSGTSISTWSFTLDPDATAVIDVRARVRSAGIEGHFDGQLLLELTDDHLVARRPLQMITDFVHDDHSVSCVHGQYGRQIRPIGQVVGYMRAEARPGVRTAIVVVNTYDGPGHPRTYRPRVTVRDAQGNELNTVLDDLGLLESRVVWLDEVFEGLESFLGGTPGTVAVHLPCPNQRVACFTHYEDRRGLIVNHGTGETWFGTPGTCPAEWHQSEPVSSCVVECSITRDTTLSFANVWAPDAAVYTAEITFFDHSGAIWFRHEVAVARRALVTVSARDLMVAHGVTMSSKPSLAHAEVRLRSGSPSQDRPAVFDTLLGIVDDGKLVGEALIGGEFLNAPVPAGSWLPDVRRSRSFVRARTGGGYRTRLLVANPSGSPHYDVTAHTLCTLIDPQGTRRTTAEIEIPPHGFLDLDVTTLFPDASEVLGPEGIGTVHLRSTDARLYGVHVLEHPSSATVAIDHLVGG
jgi:hypothetical protein